MKLNELCRKVAFNSFKAGDMLASARNENFYWEVLDKAKETLYIRALDKETLHIKGAIQDYPIMSEVFSWIYKK